MTFIEHKITIASAVLIGNEARRIIETRLAFNEALSAAQFVSQQ